MTERRKIELRAGGIDAGGEVRPLLSGEVHYWRHNPHDWPGVLDRIVGLGLRIICTYVPWSVHEIRRDEFDFGQLDPRRDLSKFLGLAHQRGLWVLVRPGPHINAELTGFGYPQRILDDPEIKAVTSTGNAAVLPQPPKVFCIPSYASEKFYLEVGRYFDALAPILRKHLWPEGPVVGIQSDNECSFLFRTAPYDLDYHPDAGVGWSDFLARRRSADGDEEEQESPAPRAVMPTSYDPQKEQDLGLYIDWAHFKEELIAGSLDRLLDMWRERGIDGLMTFHNFPPSRLKSPLNVPRVEQTHDVAGTDAYLQRHQYDQLRKRLLALVGQSLSLIHI